MSSAKAAATRLKAMLGRGRVDGFAHRRVEAAGQIQATGAVISWDWDADGGSGGWVMECQACGTGRREFPPRGGMTQQMALELVRETQAQHNREHHGSEC